MPAAGWAAKSGDPRAVGERRRRAAGDPAAIKAHGKPAIYVLGPVDAVSDAVLKQLGKLGKVKRIAAPTP